MFSVMLMTIILPMVGLAIDLTMLYIVRAKLSAAVDGGAIAAASSLSAGLSLAAQTAAAQKTALQFVTANFPTGFWGTTNLRLTPSSGADVQEDMTTTIKRRTVTIQAAVDVPLLFMRVLGWNTSTVQAYGEAGRRDVVLVLAIDRSSSMGATVTQAAAAANTFVSGFAETRDNIGLVIFGGSAVVAFPVATNFKSATPNIPSLLNALGSQSNTGTAEALSLSYQELQRVNLPGALNVIVLFTDGLPNGVTADFNNTGTVPATLIKTASSGCTYKNGPIDASTHMLGWIAQWSGFANANNGTHGIYGLMSKDIVNGPAYYMGSSHGDSNPISNAGANGCSYRSGGATPGVTTADLNTLPAKDAYGNLTTGADYTQSWIYHNKGGAAQDLTKPDNAYQIGLASWNATDNVGQAIRANANLTPLIYTIGYFGSAGEPPDPTLMMRLANSNVAPSQFPGTVNTIYDYSKPQGKFVAAMDAAAVNAAFRTIQAEILRLMK
jgi:hypothetical protein